MKITVSLRHCQYCGSKSVQVVKTFVKEVTYGYYVKCEECYAQGPTMCLVDPSGLHETTILEAVRLWNHPKYGLDGMFIRTEVGLPEQTFAEAAEEANERMYETIQSMKKTLPSVTEMEEAIRLASVMLRASAPTVGGPTEEGKLSFSFNSYPWDFAGWCVLPKSAAEEPVGGIKISVDDGLPTVSEVFKKMADTLTQGIISAVGGAYETLKKGQTLKVETTLTFGGHV